MKVILPKGQALQQVHEDFLNRCMPMEITHHDDLSAEAFLRTIAENPDAVVFTFDPVHSAAAARQLLKHGRFDDDGAAAWRLPIN